MAPWASVAEVAAAAALFAAATLDDSMESVADAVGPLLEKKLELLIDYSGVIDCKKDGLLC